VNYFQPESILEIGTSLGLATSAMAMGNPKATVTTLEGCPNTMAIAKVQLKKFNINNVEDITTEFSSYFKTKAEGSALTAESKTKPKAQDLIYFDGNHSKKATLEYFELLLPTISNETVWIFDDIHWSAEMEEAWEIIKNNPKVTVSIDTFQWGLVFFRYEQPKQHFVIRA
jgi:predicted O-methyltransferase YrrM